MGTTYPSLCTILKGITLIFKKKKLKYKEKSVIIFLLQLIYIVRIYGYVSPTTWLSRLPLVPIRLWALSRDFSLVEYYYIVCRDLLVQLLLSILYFTLSLEEAIALS